MRKYKWATNKVIQETKDAVTIVFDTTGQADFTYQPGQYLNITCEINGARVSRSYSFSSLPAELLPSITVKRVAGGKMSNYLVDHAAGIAEWDIEAPFGNFVLEQDIADTAEVVLLAGGSGISPLYAMLQTATGSGQIPLLLYSNKSPEETIFRQQLEKLEQEGRLNSFYSFTADGYTSPTLQHIAGRFSPLVIRSILRKQLKSMEDAHYFICGPAALMELYRDVLLGLNIAEHQIHTEYFEPLETMLPEFFAEGVSKEVLVNYYESQIGEEEPQEFECTQLINVLPGQSLLEAMKDHGIKVQYSCSRGTCGSCWATRDKGNVRMVNNFALSAADVSEGKILLCQSFPLDEEVSISLS